MHFPMNIRWLFVYWTSNQRKKEGKTRKITQTAFFLLKLHYESFLSSSIMAVFDVNNAPWAIPRKLHHENYGGMYEKF